MQLFRDDACGNVDTVDDVFDIVQHAGGNFGNAGFARGPYQFLIHPRQLGFRLLPFRDVLESSNASGNFTSFRPQKSRPRVDPANFAIGANDSELVVKVTAFALAVFEGGSHARQIVWMNALHPGASDGVFD